MQFLRSTFVSAVIALAVLFGFGQQVFGNCCDDEVAQTTQCPAGVVSDYSGAGDGDCPASHHDCQCLCHQHLTGEWAGLAGLDCFPLPVISILFPAALRPPQVEPNGIEVPPQLA